MRARDARYRPTHRRPCPQGWLFLRINRGRRRYTLIVSEYALAGATDPARRHVEVYPLAFVPPQDAATLTHIRRLSAALRQNPRRFQQAVTTALVEHEA